MSASLLENAIDKNFDRWELYCLNKIFHIPASVCRRMPQLACIENTSGGPVHVQEEAIRAHKEQLNRQLRDRARRLQAVRNTSRCDL